MRLLIVDRTAEGQAMVARRVESFNQSDVEMLDLRVKLVLDKDFAGQAQDADVVILGSGLGEDAASLARTALTQLPWLHIIMYVTQENYSKGAFRSALDAGVRKVLPDNASPLDLLQELVGIYSEFRREGRVREGKIVFVAHAKGGTGATTVTAALGEVCSVHRKKALLWDLDVETRDLCRSLTVSGPEAKVVSSWVNGSTEVNRDSLLEACVSVSEDVSVLMPPDSMAEAIDLVCHTDSIALCQRLLEVGKVMNDVIIIDSGGRIGPATGTLMRTADEVVIVIDDTVLGLTALDLYLSYVKTLVVGWDRISFVVNGYSGSLLAVPQIEAELEPVHGLGPRPWRMPPLRVDPKASLWPGSGKTLYSMGLKETRATLEEIAAELGLIERGELMEPADEKGGSWWNRLLPKGSSEEQLP